MHALILYGWHGLIRHDVAVLMLFSTTQFAILYWASVFQTNEAARVAMPFSASAYGRHCHASPLILRIYYKTICRRKSVSCHFHADRSPYLRPRGCFLGFWMHLPDTGTSGCDHDKAGDVLAADVLSALSHRQPPLLSTLVPMPDRSVPVCKTITPFSDRNELRPLPLVSLRHYWIYIEKSCRCGEGLSATHPERGFFLLCPTFPGKKVVTGSLSSLSIFPAIFWAVV